MLRMLFVCAVLAVLVLPPDRPAAAAVPATITGADAVNVRQGPGPDTAAIAALHRGATVQVEERIGQWALVVLENGERGYVNAAFIALAPGATLPATVETPAAVETPFDAETPPPTATGVMGGTPAIDQELAALRERLATLEATVEKSGGAPAGHVEAPIEPPPPVAMVEPPSSLDVGPAMALAGVGLVVGFLFGTFYGQRQERNRRTRVRF